ncbi:hypothetical protein [Streptomyces sp. NBC_00063]|uniref:hypothetical protein n=1 Tax=Streptomyces sp. NBC_00063 TaxID=2975638 RepID=UPI003D725684
MDAGLAGLVGALGGAVIGAGGAWGAALIALKAARYQADTQVQANHDHWLREKRSDAYGEFLRHVQLTLDEGPFHDAAYVRPTGPVGPDWGSVGELAVEAMERADELARAAQAVELHAPRHLMANVRALAEAVMEMAIQINMTSPESGLAEEDVEQYRGHLRRAERLRIDLVTECQSALQGAPALADIPTPPRVRRRQRRTIYRA